VSNVDPQHRALRRDVVRFLDEEIVPRLPEWELDEGVPPHIWERAAEVGLLCRSLKPEFGGPGDDFFSSVVIIEEIARRRLHDVIYFVLHSDVVVPYLVRFGSPQQQAHYLPNVPRAA
jgi:acyl-CoA dehydrogenase